MSAFLIDFRYSKSHYIIIYIYKYSFNKQSRAQSHLKLILSHSKDYIICKNSTILQPVREGRLIPDAFRYFRDLLDIHVRKFQVSHLFMYPRLSSWWCSTVMAVIFWFVNERQVCLLCFGTLQFQGADPNSGHFKFRLCIARAGSLRPCLMLCDERLTEDSLRITAIGRLLVQAWL